VLVQVNLPVSERRWCSAAQPASTAVRARCAKARLEVDRTEPRLHHHARQENFSPQSSYSRLGHAHGDERIRRGAALKIERQEYASSAVTAHYSPPSRVSRALSKDLLNAVRRSGLARVAAVHGPQRLTGFTASAVMPAFRFVDDHFDVLRGAIAPPGAPWSRRWATR